MTPNKPDDSKSIDQIKLYNITTQGLLINIQVQTGASANVVEGIINNRLKVKVNALPNDNEANKAIITLLAKYFKLAKADIIIKYGHKNKLKTVLLTKFSQSVTDKLDLLQSNG